jgi:hypothetical protein
MFYKKERMTKVTIEVEFEVEDSWCADSFDPNTVNKWEMYPLKAMSYRFESCPDY